MSAVSVSTRSLGKDVRAPRDAAAPWRHVDVFLVAITMSLAGMGLLLIYSATQHKENVGDISATGTEATASTVTRRRKSRSPRCAAQ